MKIQLFFCLFCFTINYSFSTNWVIGEFQTYTLPSQIANLVQDGDTISIEGGIYLDATKWTKKNLKFIGLGNSNNRTTIKYNGNIPNGKGIFVFESPGICDNAYFENIVFDGAQVSDSDGANGAGIRFQANNITINNCKFINCQNGILEGHGNVTTSNVIIENSEFENNGYQIQNDPTHSGYEHHIYISASADTLILKNNYFHHPRGQANSIKTRAQRSYILYNLIDEGETGYGSWEINIAQGGLNVIMGNVIIQGSTGANHGIIGYDAATNLIEDFYFVNNTVINKFVGNVKYFNIAPTTGINDFKIYNNIFSSIQNASITIFTGTIPSNLDSSNNIYNEDYLSFGFTDYLTNDYSIPSTSIAIDAGTDAGMTTTSFLLTPTNMYQSFSSDLLPRVIFNNFIDIGAYEFSNLSLENNSLNEKIISYPNPFKEKITVKLNGEFKENLQFQIIDIKGNVIVNKINIISSQHQEIDFSTFQKGIYFIKVFGEDEVYYKKIIKY
jgi:hypothetical protein